jgi:hypothetical protein
LLERCLRGFYGIFLGIVILTGYRPGVIDGFHPLEVPFCKINRRRGLRQIGLCLVELRLVRTRIDCEEQIPYFEVRAVDKVNLSYAPRNLRLDRHDFAGNNLSHRVDINRDVPRHSSGRCDRRRRPFKGSLLAAPASRC